MQYSSVSAAMQDFVKWPGDEEAKRFQLLNTLVRDVTKMEMTQSYAMQCNTFTM